MGIFLVLFWQWPWFLSWEQFFFDKIYSDYRADFENILLNPFYQHFWQFFQSHLSDLLEARENKFCRSFVKDCRCEENNRYERLVKRVQYGQNDRCIINYLFHMLGNRHVLFEKLRDSGRKHHALKVRGYLVFHRFDNY